MPASLSSDPVPAVVEKEASGSVAADRAFAKAVEIVILAKQR